MVQFKGRTAGVGGGVGRAIAGGSACSNAMGFMMNAGATSGRSVDIGTKYTRLQSCLEETDGNNAQHSTAPLQHGHTPRVAVPALDVATTPHLFVGCAQLRDRVHLVLQRCQ